MILLCVRAREAFSSGQRASMEQMQQLGKLFNDISLETEKVITKWHRVSCIVRV